MPKSYAIADNRAKSRHGSDFESVIESELRQYSLNYRSQPKYGNQFNPNFEIVTTDKIYIIDCTTTARSDRLKQKQFDAHGVKLILKSKSVEFFVVIKNIEGRETNHFSRAKKRIEEWKNGKINYIDEIVSFEEFKRFFRNLEKKENL